MSARDDYPPTVAGAKGDYPLALAEMRWEAMCDEIDRHRDQAAAVANAIHEVNAMNDALAADLAAAEDRANRWAYKMTLLVGWVKNNCTPEQVTAARAASLADQP